METPLLKTKIMLPALPQNHIARPSLQRQLDTALAGRCILVAAPAGSGKTTAVCSWAQALPYSFGWISLDENDNDPAQFWAYVFAALENALPDGLQLPQFHLDTLLPPTRTLLAYLINALADYPHPVVLFLDDLHQINNTAVFSDLAYLIENQPEALKIVLLTRADPPLPLARLRGPGLLGEIRGKDLRFTLEEIKTLFNRTLNLNLAPKDLSALEQRTEGWAIGLQMAALSLQTQPDPGAFITAFSGSHDYILEYLTDEVLKGLSPVHRQFLLTTSILDQLTGPLCDAVLGRFGSSAVLEELRRGNLFISSMENQRSWYRRHQLFSDLLQNLMKTELPPDQILEAHRRESSWFEQNRFPDLAINHSLKAGDFQWTADLVAREADNMMQHGRGAALLRWLEALPENILQANQRLVYQKCWALSLNGRHKEAEDLLLKLRSDLSAQSEDPEIELCGDIAALLTGICTFSNDTERILEEGQAALAVLAPERSMLRARVLIALGTALAYRGELQHAARTYGQARDLALDAENPFLTAAAIELLAGIQIYHTGELQKAALQLETILQLEKSLGPAAAFAGTSHLLLAEISLERNELEAAEAQLKKGMKLIQQGGIAYSRTHASCLQARLCLARGDFIGAQKVMREADQAAQETPLLHIQVHNLSFRIATAIRIGDTCAASKRLSTFDINL
ncbi:MAG: AAA family ATPase [Anaerolineales bacterium]|nr:AAA family ATPase [Anaerolineales bacterium]